MEKYDFQFEFLCHLLSSDFIHYDGFFAAHFAPHQNSPLVCVGVHRYGTAPFPWDAPSFVCQADL